jgi:hypothetical protein
MDDVTSRDLQPDVERSSLALCVCGEQEHQVTTTTPEDVVSVMLQGAWPCGGIGGGRHHAMSCVESTLVVEGPADTLPQPLDGPVAPVVNELPMVVFENGGHLVLLILLTSE